MARKGIRHEVYSSKVEQFYADDILISQVVINLLRNAQQALADTKNGLIRLAIEKNNEHINITVEDNGTGIPKEYADQILIPFFTTRSG